MKQTIIVSFLLLFTGNLISQELYENKINTFLDSLSAKYGNQLQDSIWKHLRKDFPEYIKNSKFGNYTFKDVNGREIKLNELDKALFLQATASWCKPCLEEIPALNDIVDLYQDRVHFILFTHDKKEKALALSKKLHPLIIVIPSPETHGNDKITKIKNGNFTHLLGFPTTYYADKMRVIQFIFAGGIIAGPNQTEEDVYLINMSLLKENIERIIE